MSQKAGLAVFIGRCQPFHLGHQHAINRALDLAQNVLVLVGDTGGPRGLKNPFTFEERKEMIAGSINSLNVEIDYVIDHPSDTEWASRVQEVVGDYADRNSVQNIILVGHEKDDSSFYLKMFPQWKFVDTGYEEFDAGMMLRYDATRMRQLIYTDNLHYAKGLIPEYVLRYLIAHERNTPNLYKDFRDEYKFLQEYRASWTSSPFPPVFVTTDCVVIQSGHILLIQRGQNPGRGLWALPGGFIDQRESIEDCALRELAEETNIKIQTEVLRRCIKTVQVFDRAGGVSDEDRGRIITHVHLIKLDDNKPLAKVKGGDDAAVAKWLPIGDINYREIFSDHGKIIQAMLGKL